MMTWLSAGLSALVGKYATSLALPACVLIILMLGHQYAKERNERKAIEATNICNATWESTIRKQERDAAQRETLAARELLAGERLINEGLQNDLQALRERAASATAAAGGNDPRCLSDSVLNLLGGSGSVKRPVATSRSRSEGGGGSDPGAPGSARR